MSNTRLKNRPWGAGCDGRRASAHTFVGPFLISHHAADRFRERMAPGLSHGHARAELVVLAKSAKRLQETTDRGDAIWVATDGAPLRFIVRKDPAHGLSVCTTVLPPDERQSGEALPFAEAV